MKTWIYRLAGLGLPVVAILYLAQPGAAGPGTYLGMSDASAAASLDAVHFVAADDELTVLRVYSRVQPGRPVHSVYLSNFLGLPARGAEADLEGVTRAGDRLYWISSHACNASGQPQPSRHQFFATTGSVTADGRIDLSPVGRPYGRLLEDLLADPRYARLGLAEASRREPKAPGALNIEALAADPSGSLWIGFRNPVTGGQALLVPLLNPEEVVSGTARARFGDPRFLDLGGLGLRSMERRGDRYWLVAGAIDGSGASRMYQWAGGLEPAIPMELPELAGLNPEAITFFDGVDGAKLWVLSDDGAVRVNGREQKRYKDPAQRRFRAVGIPLQPVLSWAGPGGGAGLPGRME